MKILILKNLTAHKERNALTSMIQTLTIIAVVFVLTMLNLELLSFTSYKDLHKIDIWTRFGSFPEELEPIFTNYTDGIEDFAYFSNSLSILYPEVQILDEGTI